MSKQNNKARLSEVPHHPDWSLVQNINKAANFWWLVSGNTKLTIWYDCWYIGYSESDAPSDWRDITELTGHLLAQGTGQEAYKYWQKRYQQDECEYI